MGIPTHTLHKYMDNQSRNKINSNGNFNKNIYNVINTN